MPDIAVPFFTAVPASPLPWPGLVVAMEGNGMSPQRLRVYLGTARCPLFAFFARHLREQ